MMFVRRFSGRRPAFCAMALAVLAACQPAIPDSGAGVGFDRVDAERQAQLNRDAQLAGDAPAEPALTAPASVSEQSLGSVAESALDASAAEAAAAQNSGVTPVEASPSNPPPQAVTNSAGFSAEQDFDAVSNRRSIEDDAERLAAARAQYVVIQPGDLPTRPGTNVPNIVEYALRTNNPVGARVYSRSGFNQRNRNLRNCSEFASDDFAQEEFLMLGGPQRDRKALDPDGDGYACSWDPTPIRRALQSN